MAVNLTNSNVESLQRLEVGISGPDGANRMYITTGLARTPFYANANQTTKENFKLRVDPPLTASQFRRAIATAAIADMRFYDYDPANADGIRWAVEEVDADFDDENGKVELRFTLTVSITGSASAAIDAVSFTVTALAEIV